MSNVYKGMATAILDPDTGDAVTTTTVGSDIGLDVNVIGGTVDLEGGSEGESPIYTEGDADTTITGIAMLAEQSTKNFLRVPKVTTTNYYMRMDLSTGDNEGYTITGGAAQTFSSANTASQGGININARNAQLWSSEHDLVGGDDNYYGQNQNDFGDLIVDFAAIKGVRTATGSGVIDTGTQRIAIASDQLGSLFDLDTGVGTENVVGTSLRTEASGGSEAAGVEDNPLVTASALVPEEHDYIGLTYVAAGNGAGEIETVTYKEGGSGGTTVATLTLAYDANDKLSTVTRT